MNEDAIVYQPEEKHYCNSDGLPPASNYPVDSIARCLVCGSYYFVYEGTVTNYWEPVRWHHFRKRAIIRSLEGEA